MYFWFPLQWQLCLCCSTALVVTKAFAFKYKGKKERLKNMVNIITIIAALNSSALKFCCGSISAIITTQGNQRKRVWAKKPLKLYLDQSQHSDCKTNYFPFVCVFWKKIGVGHMQLFQADPQEFPILPLSLEWNGVVAKMFWRWQWCMCIAAITFKKYTNRYRIQTKDFWTLFHWKRNVVWLSINDKTMVYFYVLFVCL